MFEEVVDSIHSYARLSEKELEDFTSRLQPKTFKKDEMMLEKDKVCQSFNFIKKGSFRQYYLSENYEEITINLFTANEWVLDHESFTGQKPSRNTIKAFEESEVLIISIHDLHDLIGKSQAYFGLGRILETGFSNLYQRDNTASPEEKYLKLLDQKPELIQIFPLKYIASFLGITPETLSRVRSKIR